MSASALPGKTKTSDMCIKVNKDFNKFYIFTPVASNSQSFTLSVMQHCLNQMTLTNVDEFKK